MHLIVFKVWMKRDDKEKELSAEENIIRHYVEQERQKQKKRRLQQASRRGIFQFFSFWHVCLWKFKVGRDWDMDLFVR